MKISPVLVVGIALPLLFISALLAVTVLPSTLLKPQHDFIYSNESPYAFNGGPYAVGYSIQQGILVQTPYASSTVAGQIKQGSPTLYRYDVRTNAVHQLSFEEASQLKLDPGPTSPDGFTVSYQTEGGGPFFYSGGGSAYYLKKGSAGKALSGIGDGYQAYGRFRFIGWILK